MSHLPRPPESFPSPAACQQLVAVVQAMLEGRLGVAAGTREVLALQPHVTRLDLDPDFLPFVGIHSETHVFPHGEPRQHWAAADLARMDSELAQVEAHYREFAFRSCRRLVERFSPQSSATPNA